MFRFKIHLGKVFSLFSVICVLACATQLSNAQSSDQNFPTPVTANQISGTIKARPIGDSRLTTYYFTFNGNQGDIFLNIVTSNFNGDIDVFTVDGLRPLTKIVVYADSSLNETGRVIYLRKPEKILLRIQGRTPNDDPATFQFKFAGSFLASTDTEVEAPKVSEDRPENNSGIIVNEVGTIIEVKPKPTPEPKEAEAEKTNSETIAAEEVQPKEESETSTRRTEEIAEAKPARKPKNRRNKKTEVVKNEAEVQVEKEVTTPLEQKDPDKSETDSSAKNENAEQAETVEKTEPAETVKEEPKKKTRREKPKKATEPNALENIFLVVLLKEGGKIERPMSEVLKFGVEKGILTIISKNGSISRYSILDVESVTIK